MELDPSRPYGEELGLGWDVPTAPGTQKPSTDANQNCNSSAAVKVTGQCVGCYRPARLKQLEASFRKGRNTKGNMHVRLLGLG